MGAQRYEAAGKIIVCPHCACDRFDNSLHSMWGYTYDCSRCTARLFFSKKLKQIDDNAI